MFHQILMKRIILSLLALRAVAMIRAYSGRETINNHL